jgi:hypothetical protein
MDFALSRRELLLAAACWAEVLRGQAGRPRFVHFDSKTADEIAAIAAQIIPEDETPGAAGAGVISFIDQSLAGYDQDKRELYARGLAETQARRAQMFPGSTTIARLTGEQQIMLLKDIENTDFFRAVRLHTILGYFGRPVGLQLLGVRHAMHYEPPFGFYDAEQRERESH